MKIKLIVGCFLVFFSVNVFAISSSHTIISNSIKFLHENKYCNAYRYYRIGKNFGLSDNKITNKCDIITGAKTGKDAYLSVYNLDNHTAISKIFSYAIEEFYANNKTRTIKLFFYREKHKNINQSIFGIGGSESFIKLILIKEGS
jgi:hypothetical protein